MHRMLLKLKTFTEKLEKGMKSGTCFFQKYAGQIAYYACMALVLTAVAMAAERYRDGGKADDALILPAVEISVPVTDKEAPLFEMPAGMRVLRTYSALPEWNGTHRQWEIHAATDVVYPEDMVTSLSDGEILTVGRSGIYGGFVEIETGDYLFRYASISPLDTVLPGKSIKKGECLGSADASMPGEAHMPKHLHLELYRNGESVDFIAEYGKKSPTVD